MNEPQITVNTIMTKEDYKKFLYIATFRRNKLVLPLLGFIALVASVILSFNDGHFNPTLLIFSWIFLFGLSIAVVMFKVERKNAQRIKTDQTGTFDSINTIKFCDDRIVMENASLKSTGELKYNQFYALLESKDYFIFYWSLNQASLIRKKDVQDVEVLKTFLSKHFQGNYKHI